MSRCDLYLDNYATCYYAGQQIVGRLKCTFNSDKTIRGIHIQLKGDANVHWTESRTTRTNGRSTTTTTTFSAHESLIEQRIDLKYQRGAEFTVPKGEHTFPFSFELPNTLPSTFKASDGRVVYQIKGYVDRALAFDYKAKSEINVVEILDLNLYAAETKNPVNISEHKTVGCCCWKSGPIDVQLNVPFTGFVPGQNIPLHIQIENMSNTSISQITYELRQYQQFHSTRKTRSYSNTVATCKDTGVGAHGERTYEKQFLVPTTFIPINLKHCRIIDISHKLKIEIVIPGCHSNVSMEIPVLIGNVGLQIMSDVMLPPNYTAMVDNLCELAPSAPPPMFTNAAMGSPSAAPSIGWSAPAGASTEEDSQPPAYDDIFSKK